MKTKEPEFIYFEDSWNETPTNKDERGEYYDTDFQQGVDEYQSNDRNITSIED